MVLLEGEVSDILQLGFHIGRPDVLEFHIVDGLFGQSHRTDQFGTVVDGDVLEAEVAEDGCELVDGACRQPVGQFAHPFARAEHIP